MKIAGTIQVEVPECEGFSCHPDCSKYNTNCQLSVFVVWNGPILYNVISFEGEWPQYGYIIPGPTCPAFDSVPNPWADEFPDRPWDDEAEDALVEARIKRLTSADK